MRSNELREQKKMFSKFYPHSAVLQNGTKTARCCLLGGSTWKKLVNMLGNEGGRCSLCAIVARCVYKVYNYFVRYTYLFAAICLACSASRFAAEFRLFFLFFFCFYFALLCRSATARARGRFTLHSKF